MIVIRFGIRNISELDNGIFRMTDSQLDNSIKINSIKVLNATSKFNLMGILTLKCFTSHWIPDDCTAISVVRTHWVGYPWPVSDSNWYLACAPKIFQIWHSHPSRRQTFVLRVANIGCFTRFCLVCISLSFCYDGISLLWICFSAVLVWYIGIWRHSDYLSFSPSGCTGKGPHNICRN